MDDIRAPKAVSDDAQSHETAAVIDSHIDYRQRNDVDGDIAHNYADDVVILTSDGARHGAAAIHDLHERLSRTVPPHYEIVTRLAHGPYGFISWRAREPGKSVEDGADSFVGRRPHRLPKHPLQRRRGDAALAGA